MLFYNIYVFNLTDWGLKSKMYNIQLVFINYCKCLKVYMNFRRGNLGVYLLDEKSNYAQIVYVWRYMFNLPISSYSEENVTRVKMCTVFL